MWLLVFIDGNDAATNTPILFTTNWDADDSGSEFLSTIYCTKNCFYALLSSSNSQYIAAMSDEADTSNDGDMGNDMHDFHGMKNFNFFIFPSSTMLTDWLYIFRWCKWCR